MTGYSTKTKTSAVFEHFYASGTQEAELTKSLLLLSLMAFVPFSIKFKFGDPDVV